MKEDPNKKVLTREELTREMQKHRRRIILSALGVVIALVLALYLYTKNNTSFWWFLAFIILDIFELPSEIDQYKDAKKKLQK